MEISETWKARRGFLDVPGLFAMTGRRPFALLYGDGALGRWLVFAEDPLVSIDGPALDGFSVERRGEVPPILPDFIGHISYEWGYGLEPAILGEPLAPLFPLPDFRFALYRRLVLFDREEGLIYEAERRVEGGGAEELGDLSLQAGEFSASKTDDTDDAPSYEGKVVAIREEIARGNVYQVDLTRQESWAWRGDLRRFALELYAANPAPFSAMIAWPGWAIVSSSPERFLELRKGRLTARPIKGTAPRGASPAEDEALSRGLLESAKDRAELAMIVDLLRNDLSRACVLPSVRVDGFPLLESYANVHHLVARVSGDFRREIGLPGLLAALFPGGSITGCPKLAAMSLIRALEPRARSVYTGALGWFTADLSGLDFNIPIRTVWAGPESLAFGVGGAVVWDSDPRLEYEETLHKGRSIERCLSSHSKR